MNKSLLISRAFMIYIYILYSSYQVITIKILQYVSIAMISLFDGQKNDEGRILDLGQNPILLGKSTTRIPLKPMEANYKEKTLNRIKLS